MQDPDSRAVINKLFGVEQHTSLRNEESGESIEVGFKCLLRTTARCVACAPFLMRYCQKPVLLHAYIRLSKI